MSEENTVVEENVTTQTEEIKNEESKKTVEEPKTEASVKQENTYVAENTTSRRLKGMRKEDNSLLRDKMILSRISDKDLLEYLKLEKERMELLQHAKEARAKRFLSAFEIVLALVCTVVAIYFLKDEPTILMSILYICGILVAMWIWKKPRD